MPNLNGKGPMGSGAMTGRKRGRCANSKVQKKEEIPDKIVEENNTGLGNGQDKGICNGERKRLRLGRGFGRGRRNSS